MVEMGMSFAITDYSRAVAGGYVANSRGLQVYIYGERGERNPMLTDRLKDIDIMGEQVMWPAGRRAAYLFKGIVAKRSGALAASARPQLTVGGELMDRIVVDVISGEDLPRGGYGASHEYGIGIHPRSRVPPTPWMPQQAVNDWQKVLAFMSYESGLQRSFYTLDIGGGPTRAPRIRPRARRSTLPKARAEPLSRRMTYVGRLLAALPQPRVPSLPRPPRP